jgi:hypothetical protein
MNIKSANEIREVAILNIKYNGHRVLRKVTEPTRDNVNGQFKDIT